MWRYKGKLSSFEPNKPKHFAICQKTFVVNVI